MRKLAFGALVPLLVVAVSGCSSEAPLGRDAPLNGSGGAQAATGGSAGTTGTGGSGVGGNTTGGSTGSGGYVSGTGGTPVLDLGDASIGDGGPCGTNLTGIVRDFKASDQPGGHPDFQSSVKGQSLGLVEPNLGPDRKPVPSDLIPTLKPLVITSKDSFNQWYRDTQGVNQSTLWTLPIVPVEGEVVTYSAIYDVNKPAESGFFPIDGQLFGNYPNPDSLHNYLFTFELHTTFVYQGGEIFTFYGDDDLWVFVNGKLAVDLGGLHPPESGTADLDALAASHGLVIDGVYSLDLFHAERRVWGSTFQIETSIAFNNCEPILIY
jgi:fibro-slime domain-containing protein